MPYISPNRKALLEGRYSEHQQHAVHKPLSAGELTYLITRDALEYCEVRNHRFSTYAEVLGAIEAAKQEFYRRVVAPYENEKCEQNGDVYP